MKNELYLAPVTKDSEPFFVDRDDDFKNVKIDETITLQKSNTPVEYYLIKSINTAIFIDYFEIEKIMGDNVSTSKKREIVVKKI